MARQSEDESSSPESEPGPANKPAFAVFSPGLAAALPLLSLIDPCTDEDDHQPSTATIDLIGDTETNRYKMSKKRMKQLFPVICRDDEHRNWRTKGMHLHGRVFICCDNDQPKDQGVLVMQMEWDEGIERDEKALQTIGTNAVVHELRVEVEAALAKAYQIAKDLD